MKFFNRKKLSAFAAVMLLQAVFTHAVSAAVVEITQTWVAGEDEPTSTIDGVVTPAWGWPNIVIPDGNPAIYRLMGNYWNTDTTIAGTSLNEVTMVMMADNATGEFWLTDAPNSHYPEGRTEGACHAEDPGCNWTPGNGHAPAIYPAIYKGCHYNQCTAGGGAPFPMMVSEVASLPSSWTVDLGAAATAPGAAFNVAYDIWLNQTEPTTSTGQNDGAEIMIWLNNRGYDEGNNTENPIRPAGELRQSGLVIPGVPGTWDVWIEPVAGTDVNWRIISYVREDRVTSMDFDSKLFLEDAMTRDCDGIPCVHPNWWLSSVQSGFEVWSNGDGLRSVNFSVEPVSVSGEVTGIARTDDGRPIVHWLEPFTLATAGCANGTASFVLTPSEGPAFSGALIETPAGSGVYEATIGPVQPSHGDTIIDTTINCPDGSVITQSVPVFIDPSGFIMDTNGYPVEGATVTLWRMVGGTYRQAPALASIMDPAVNPQVTSTDGRFGWDVVPNTYKVRAEKAGCHAPGNPSQAYVETGDLPVPPEYTNIYLYLECDGGNPNPGDVAVQIFSDWGVGYCAFVTVTNNTASPLDWKVDFEADGAINNFWNVIWSQQGNKVTAEGVYWNNILQPGESSHSLGFCASR